MPKFLIIASILIAAALFFGYMFSDKKSQPILKINDTEIRVELADNPAERYQGLSGRESMCDDCGMLFLFDRPGPRNFSMRGMRFPLDFVFIREGEVAEVRESIQPPRPSEAPEQIVSSSPADAVLEVNAGFSRVHNIQAGDKVTY